MVLSYTWCSFTQQNEALVGSGLADLIFIVQTSEDTVTQHLTHLLRLEQEDNVLLQVSDEMQLQLPNQTREVWLCQDPTADLCEVGQSGAVDLLVAAVEVRKTVTYDDSQRLHHV